MAATYLHHGTGEACTTGVKYPWRSWPTAGMVDRQDHLQKKVEGLKNVAYYNGSV